MADVAVQFLIENLMQLLKDNAQLIFGIKDQIEGLLRDVSGFKAFLIDITQGRNQNNETLKDLVKQIRIAVNDAEDSIDKYVVAARLHKAKGFGAKFIDAAAYTRKIREIATAIAGIRDRINTIRRENEVRLQALPADDRASSGKEEKREPVVEEDDVVGFDGEARTLIERLSNGSDNLEVISLYGMPGLGKTTLAKKVYKDPNLSFNSFFQHWIYVSKRYSGKDIFLSILRRFTKRTRDYESWSDQSLAEEVRKKLSSLKYFLVVDDVWSIGDWDRIKVAFPATNKGSRILLTTRDKTVAFHANSVGQPHNLKFLGTEDSCKLLKNKAFRKSLTNWPVELERPGLRIVQKCGGLPLALVVIGGVLFQKGGNTKQWQRVADHVETYLTGDYTKLVELSYENLTYELKACFLYFGAFAQGLEIPAWKLIRLWIAEGFIQPQGRLSLEEIAQDRLNELVNRNLVMTVKRTWDGEIKTCRVHDTMHGFCKDKADKEENLFQEIDMSPGQPFPSQEQFATFRRLCVHSSVSDFITNIPSAEHVRSFLSFPSKEIELPLAHISAFPKAFPLIRVLEIECLRFPRFCKPFFQLFHLRYICISMDLPVLPKPFEDLWNVQTLIVKTSKTNLEIKADIWKLTRLRHLQTNTSAQLPPLTAPNSRSDPLVNRGLETLSTISPDSCREEVLVRTPDVKKLGIRGKISALLETRAGHSLFDNLGMLNAVENLKLFNDGSWPGVPRLPQAYRFPRNMKKLTLSGTGFEWNDMSILGTLDHLEYLKLEENAFMGEFWEPKDGGFRCLKILNIGRTNIVNWKAASHHFPRLESLILKNCLSLAEVPIGLADVPRLVLLDLHCTTPSAAKSARDIQKLKAANAQQLKGSASFKFKLSIFPPDR